jgi:hypothetical protein
VIALSKEIISSKLLFCSSNLPHLLHCALNSSSSVYRFLILFLSQVGDILDRGDQEIKLLFLLEHVLSALAWNPVMPVHDCSSHISIMPQVGDILDRGDQEIKLLFLLERLQRQAQAAGGALHVLNGNHETMNVGGNFRYATAGRCALGLSTNTASYKL